jgi:tetratricopeptide (TPR) repeat protein
MRKGTGKRAGDRQVATILRATLTIWSLMAAPVPQATADSPFDAAISAYNAKHYDKAIGLFGEAEPTNFNNPILHYYLANALAYTNHRADAIKQYKLALLLDPSDQLAQYCKAALKNLETQPATSAKSDKEISAPTAIQTPQILAVLCLCPLCQNLDTVLSDVSQKYGEKILVTRIFRKSYDPHQKPVEVSYDRDGEPVPNNKHIQTETADDRKKNDAIINKYDSKHHCPTLMFFGTDGELANKMTGVIANLDIYKQASAILTQKGSTTAAAPILLDKSVEEKRAAILAEAQARVTDAQRLRDEEIKRIQQNADRDRANNIVFSRRGGYVRQQIEDDSNKRIEQIKADFEKKQTQIMDEANARADGLTAGQSPYNNSIRRPTR